MKIDQSSPSFGVVSLTIIGLTVVGIVAALLWEYFSSAAIRTTENVIGLSAFVLFFFGLYAHAIRKHGIRRSKSGGPRPAQSFRQDEQD